MKPYLASDLKDLNRKTVYRLILSSGEISKAEISRKTGISSPTVIKIVNFFTENGFLIPAGEGSTALGRKPQMLRFNSEAAFSIGIEFEGDFLKIGIVDLLGHIKHFKRFTVKPDFKYIVNKKLESYIDQIISESGIERSKILGVGLGVPCAVDCKNQTIDVAPLVKIFEKTNYSSMLASLLKKINLPVIIENDVNSAAIGEYVHRRLENDQDMVFISMGTGLGAGIILDGALRRGAHGFAGEIGYMVFDKGDQILKSRAGWLESRLNIRTILEGNRVADIVQEAAGELALTVANISTFLDIDRVVIGGLVPEILGQNLLDALNDYLSRLSIMNFKCELQQCLEPGVVGTASLMTEKVLNEMHIDEM